MSVESKNILVLGEGPAGLSAASELAKANHNVEVIGPDLQRMEHSVYTTDRSLSPETSKLFFPEAYIKCLPGLRTITTQGADFTVGTNGNKYFVLDYPGAISVVEGSLPKDKVVISKLPASAVRNIEVVDQENGVLVRLDGGVKGYDAVVDATGANSKISNKPGEDFLSEYVYGVTTRGQIDSSDMILTMGTSGGTSWANPSILGEDFVDVVFSAYGPKKYFLDFLRTAKPRMKELVNFLSQKKGIYLDPNKEPEKIFSGVIRQQPMTMPTYRNVYSTGEAAGMAGPGTGDSIRRAVYAGEMLSNAISSGQTPQQFYKDWRGVWSSDKVRFAAVLGRLSFQEKNKLNDVTNEVGAWFDEDGGPNGNMVRRIEDYLIDGKMSWELLLKIARSPKVIKGFGLAGKEMVKQKLYGTRLPDHLPLPEV